MIGRRKRAPSIAVVAAAMPFAAAFSQPARNPPRVGYLPMVPAGGDASWLPARTKKNSIVGVNRRGGNCSLLNGTDDADQDRRPRPPDSLPVPSRLFFAGTK